MFVNLIFRELGIMPMASSLQAEAMLTEQGLAFLPLTALCPGIHNLLTLRSRMGVRNSAHSLVKLLNPFHVRRCWWRRPPIPTSLN